MVMGVSELPSGRDASSDDHWLGFGSVIGSEQLLLGLGVTLSTHVVRGAKYQCSRPSPTLCRFTVPWRKCDGAAQGQGQ